MAAGTSDDEVELAKVLNELKTMQETSTDDALLIDRILNMGWSTHHA